MVLDEKQFPILGKDIQQLEIIDGPSDWDMWMCLRGTFPEVIFYTPHKTPFFVPTAGDPKEWLEIKITSMQAEDSYSHPEKWGLEGKTRNCHYCIPFLATYNSRTRKGSAKLGPVKP